ncbi:hypothetical protein Dimus_020212 [Dionaea muscipula]
MEKLKPLTEHKGEASSCFLPVWRRAELRLGRSSFLAKNMPRPSLWLMEGRARGLEVEHMREHAWVHNSDSSRPRVRMPPNSPLPSYPRSGHRLNSSLRRAQLVLNLGGFRAHQQGQEAEHSYERSGIQNGRARLGLSTTNEHEEGPRSCTWSISCSRPSMGRRPPRRLTPHIGSTTSISSH